MRTLLLFAFFCSMTFTAPAAEPQPRVKGDAIYFYCTSRTDPDEGVERGENPANDNDPLYVHRPIFFQMVSKTKDIYIDFAFFNYNPVELSKTRPVIPAKDQMEIVTGPRTMLRFINTFNPITLENKLASFKTKEESWAWVDSLKATGKQIYLIDWNDPINGSGGTELRLIQVRPTLTNRPSY
nr:hypothetical protein [uncultured Alistipes sp.]